MSKEPHVPERRSIFRGFKKFFGKKSYLKGTHYYINTYIDQLFDGIP